jgi:hypothetical protein
MFIKIIDKGEVIKCIAEIVEVRFLIIQPSAGYVEHL